MDRYSELQKLLLKTKDTKLKNALIEYLDDLHSKLKKIKKLIGLD